MNHPNLVPSPPTIPPQEAVRDIGVSILLTIVTCGLYGLYWQYQQFRTVNAWLGRNELGFGTYLVLSIVTCGVYALYHEYKVAQAICEVQRQRGMKVDDNLPLLALALAFFGLAIVTWSIEQAEVNRWYASTPALPDPRFPR